MFIEAATVRPVVLLALKSPNRRRKREQGVGMVYVNRAAVG